ncbi:MAG TPA: aspartate aminotransferase family protein [Chthoniobacteraceae bacterium]|jgi:acetylornithine/succinyldiaminopimelate/putrescine aminotransferase|nr:aspartate aminotransferase family protein [Chthoniobacteraceae bacterium]
MPIDIKQIVTERLGENYELHERYINRTLVNVQRTIGFDKVYANAQGAYLYDLDGQEYLDFLSGYSVYNIGRNHPAVKQAIRETLDLDLPNMVQMDCSLLSGVLAEALVKRMPAHLNAVFFCNSGAEAMEGAIKFARAATGRGGLISLEGAFHGLSMGALSVMGNPHFQDGFGPYLEGCHRVRIGDLEVLEKLLAAGDIAGVILEPVQGKGVKYPVDDFFVRAQELCRRHGALLISDEVQCGLGRTGKWMGFQHWDLEPDIVTLAKSLSGGYVPVGAIVTRRDIYQKTFNQLDRCVVHSSTFGRNNLAMVCGLATLQVIEDENLVENAGRMGELLVSRLNELKERHSVIKEVRGKGLILAIEFHEPKEMLPKLGWNFLHKMEVNLFTQMVVTALLSKHRILTQVAAHGLDTLKILPPLMIGEKEVDKFISALDSVLKDCRKFPGPLWDLGANFVRHSLRKPATVP